MAPPTICYEHILRAIGQGLESLSLEAFDLEVADDTFSIQGIPTRKESEKPTLAPLNAFKKAFLEHLSQPQNIRAIRNPCRKCSWLVSFAAAAIYASRH